MPDRNELASVVDDVFEDVLAVIRSAQEANLTFAWRLGKILDQALDSYDDRYGRGIARELVRRLNECNCDIKLSSLYAYRTIFRTYDETEIPALVERGITQTHAQTLAALPTEVRQEAEEKLHREDGTVLSTRELKRMVDDLKKDHARETSQEVAERSAEARASGDRLVLEPTRTSAQAEENDDMPPPRSTTAQSDTTTNDTERSGNAELTKQSAEQTTRSFTQPPLRTVKTADNTAIKMLAQASQLLVALDEANRIGFDSDRSLQSFIDAAESLDASLASYHKVLPELRERIRSAVVGNTLRG